MFFLFKRPVIFLLFITGFFFLFYLSTTPKIPTPYSEPILYSNQCKDDIKGLFLSAITNAKNSVHLLSFGLSDPNILHALIEKAREVKVKAYYDQKASKPLPYIEGIEWRPVKEIGLMHQKIVVIDEKIVFLGTANLTQYSLQMHDNLLIGLYSPKIAKFLVEKTPFSPSHMSTFIGGQKIDLWILPDAKNYALESLVQTIRSAKKKLFVAMFTLTHPTLIDEVIAARKRGVNVKVVVDKTASKGASKEAVKSLKENFVPVRISTGMQFLHHKFLLVDEKHLVLGSANWTKSAFYKNRDCFLILHNLKKKQKEFMKTLVENICNESIY